MPIGSPKSISACKRFFLEPSSPKQRQYEALRAYFAQELPSAEAARAFGYTPGAPGTGAVLPLMYCLLPCVLKLGAIAMLLRTEEK